MEHLIHPFIPGTPENMAIMAMWPSLAPLFSQIVQTARGLHVWARGARNERQG
jgi:hypothetical protein